MLLDILIVSIVILFLEKIIVGSINYLPFSPLFVFLSAYNLLFVLPVLFNALAIGKKFYMARLEVNYFDEYIYYNRWFFYVFCILTLVYFVSSKNSLKKQRIEKQVHRSWVVFLFLIALVAKYVYLGTGLNFNPSLILERMIFPREFTYIREGVGLELYIQAALTLLAYFMAVLLYIQKKNKINLLLMILAILLFFIGGGKQQIIWMMFNYIMLKNKQSKLIYFSFFNNIKYILIVSFLVVFAFTIMIVRTDNSTLGEKMASYQRESYYSALVITDFEWAPEYSINGVVDTLLAPVPRSLWKEKPYIGYYNRYWREVYEPKTVRYHSSTYGFIAESHMLFGSFGAIAFSFIFFFLVKYCYINYLTSTTYMGAFFPIYLTTFLYFFLRAGFTGFTFLVVIFTYIFGLLFINKSYKLKF
jgi:oligosaccharide repeat unit polymerase